MVNVIALAIAVVVGRATPPYHAIAHRGTTMCSAEQPTKVDALRAGERLEPRVAPAPPTDRAPPLPPFWLARTAHEPRVAPPRAVDSSPEGARDRRIVVLQRIPRLESGDPPRG